MSDTKYRLDLCDLSPRLCGLMSQSPDLASRLPARRSPLLILHFLIYILHFAFSSPASATSPLAVPVDDPSFRGQLIAVADARLTFAVDGQKKTIPAADLVRWGRCPEQGRAGALVLADGSLINAEIVAADKDRLTADSDLFGTLKIPIESLAGVVFHAPSDRLRHDLLLDRLVRAAGESDRLILDNGDELTGLVDGIAAGQVNLKTDAGAVEPIKSDRITAILFNPALRIRTPHAPRPSSPHAPREEGPSTPHAPREGTKNAADATSFWTAFTDGSRLLATRLSIDGNSLKLTAAGQSFAAPRSSLVFLQPLSGRAVYLSDLKPAEYRQTPFVVLSWPYLPDRNVTGGLLRSANQLYLKGLGVHSAARLAYNLSPLPSGERSGVRAGARSSAVDHFAALAVIDDSTAGQGSVIFRVLVDGQERFTSPVVRGGDAPVPVSVDLRGAKKLELLVDYADRADVLDHANWLDARLIQQDDRQSQRQEERK
jgi:hypothetical protein